MHDTFAAIIKKMGGGTAPAFATTSTITGSRSAAPSFTRSATVRMGDDPKTSALNKYSQAHDVKNLFVMDAAPFVSNPDKNPTLTICAFAWRASEYLAEEMRKGNV